jgi:hypothetical protein
VQAKVPTGASGEGRCQSTSRHTFRVVKTSAVDSAPSLAGSALGWEETYGCSFSRPGRCDETSARGLDDNAGPREPRTAGSNPKVVKDGLVLQARL